MKLKTILALAAAAVAVTLATSAADPIPATTIPNPDVTVSATLTADQTSALLSSFSLPSSTAGMVLRNAIIIGHTDGTSIVRATFQPTPTPTPSPTP